MDYIETIKVFANVVDKGNFTRSAESLGVTASYVSKAMTSLEQRLCCKLFQRSTRHVQLTEAGGVFYQKALDIIDLIGCAENEVHELVDKPQGCLRVSAPASFASFLEESGFIDSFLETYPDISLDLEMDNRVVDLVREGFDLSLRIAVKLPDSNLVAKPITSFKSIICCSPSYIERFGKPRRVSELIGHNCLLFKAAVFNEQWMLKKDGKTVSIPVQGNLSSNNVDVLKSSALRGAGITILPEDYIRDELSSGELLRLFPSYGSSELTLYAMYADRRWTPKKTRLFIEHLISVANN